MALNVAWRWAMPQVGSPNAQADAMAAGVQGLAQGIGDMISNANKEKWREQNQANLDRDFELRQDQVLQNQRNWQKQFDQSKALQDFNMQRQKTQDEWLQKFYDQFFGDDEEYQELLKLREQFAGQPSQVSDAALIMMGLNPALR